MQRQLDSLLHFHGHPGGDDSRSEEIVSSSNNMEQSIQNTPNEESSATLRESPFSDHSVSSEGIWGAPARVNGNQPWPGWSHPPEAAWSGTVNESELSGLATPLGRHVHWPDQTSLNDTRNLKGYYSSSNQLEHTVDNVSTASQNIDNTPNPTQISSILRNSRIEPTTSNPSMNTNGSVRFDSATPSSARSDTFSEYFTAPELSTPSFSSLQFSTRTPSTGTSYSSTSRPISSARRSLRTDLPLPHSVQRRLLERQQSRQTSTPNVSILNRTPNVTHIPVDDSRMNPNNTQSQQSTQQHYVPQNSFSSYNQSMTCAQEFVRSCSTVLPKFDPRLDDADEWWSICEKMFESNHIVDPAVKFQLILVSFKKEELKALNPFLSVGTPQHRYENLKRGIFKLFSLTDRERITKVLSMQYDGKSVPSILFHDIKLGFGKNLLSQPNFLRNLFLDKLPPLLRSQLAPFDGLPELDFLDMADKIFLSNRERGKPEVAKESSAAGSNDATNLLLFQTLSQMQNQLADLTAKAGEKQKKTFYSANTAGLRHPGPDNFRRQNYQQAPNPSGFCFYHAQFGSNARKCVPPCKWSVPPSGNFQPRPGHSRPRFNRQKN